MMSMAERTSQPDAIEEKCLVKVGKTGEKTHIGYLTYEIKNAGKPWQSRTLIQAIVACQTGNSGSRRGNLGVRRVPGDVSLATCEHCKPRD